MKRIQLLHALEKVQPGLANKEIIEQSASFIFLKDRIVTYNDEISVAYKFKGLGINGAVNAERFYKLLSKLDTEEIDIQTTDTELKIKAGRGSAVLPLKKDITLPLEDIPPAKTWMPVSGEFIPALKLAISCCAKDTSKPILTCIHITKKGIMEASDGYRAIRIRMDEKVPSMLLPSKCAIQIAKYNVQQIAINESWARFKDGKTIISSRLFKDNYPNTNKIFDNISGNKIKLKASLVNILERARIFSTDETTLTEFVRMKIKDNKIIISGNSAHGVFSEYAKIKYTDKALDFLIQPQVLKELLNNKHYIGTYCDNRLQFKTNTWEYVLYLIMPKGTN